MAPENKGNEEERTFSPSDEQASRTRMQGGGVGQKEMNQQRDPNRADRVDQYDFDGDDNPQEDGGDPSGGMQQGATNTMRPDRTEQARGQGAKTRAAQKAEINREAGFGPKGG